MRGWQRWLIAGAAAAAVVGAVGLVWHRSGIGSAAVMLGVVGSLAGLIGGWFAWARRTPTGAELEVVDKNVREEALKRSVGTLKDLVSRQGLLDLGVEPRLRLVHDPAHPTTAADVSDVPSAFQASHHRLLIVGEPAAGKTIAAYQVAELIADDTELDRVPLVVNLSAWADQDPFDRFLVDYLCAPGAGYGIADRKTARAWLTQRRFALVLDGLDEVPAEWRADLLSRLDVWLPVAMPAVLTCRTREYNNLIKDRHRGIGLAMAVEVQPLDDEQLDKAFTEIVARVDESWSHLIGRWKSGRRWAVREASRSPLVLNLAVSSGLTSERLRDAGRRGAEAVREFVIDEYLDKALRDDPALQSWARWIASYLAGLRVGPFGSKAADSTVFELSRLTPDRMPWPYAAATGGLVSLLLWDRTTVTVQFFLPIGLAFLVPWFRRAAPSKVQVSALRWHTFKTVFPRSLLIALLVGLAFVPLFLLDGFPLSDALEAGLLVGPPVGLLYGLWQLLRPSRLWVSGALDDPWRQSRRTAWRLGLLLGLALGLWVVLTEELMLGLSGDWLETLLGILSTAGLIAAPVGLLVALNGGGWFLMIQRLARRRLHRSHGLDPQPLTVLKRGTQPRYGALPLLRPVGSGIRFIHNDVRDRLVTTTDTGSDADKVGPRDRAAREKA